MEEKGRVNKQNVLIVLGLFVLIGMVGGLTYAFFNFTRTGAPNTIRTGRIDFDAEQSQAVTLSDLFPIAVSGNVTASTPGVGSMSIHVTGDTSYSEGVEYLVKAVNVTNTNGANLPISINIDYQASDGQGNTIGQEDTNYFTNRGGNTSRYKILSHDTISEGEDLVVGYIAPGQTGIDGNIIVLAYLDARNIAITDTNPEGTTRLVNVDGFNSSTCQTALTGEANASTYCASASSLQAVIDNSTLTEAQITALVNAGVVGVYTDGTTNTWVDNRTVFTTDQWNALQANGVSFQIKVEAREGTWVTVPNS